MDSGSDSSQFEEFDHREAQYDVRYPVFSAISDVLEQYDGEYDSPPNGTNVYTSWSCAVIELLDGKKHGLSVQEIQENLIGTWILRGSKQYVQLCWGNIDFYINEQSLTMCFLFDDSSSVWINRQEALSTNNRVFVFQSDKSLSFTHVVYNALDALVLDAVGLPVAEFLEYIHGATFRTVFGKHQSIDSARDSSRIIYAIECIGEFQIRGDVIIRQKKDRVFSNDAVRILAENDPLFCGYTPSQVCALLGIEGDEAERKAALEKIILCEEVFYYNEVIGVRPDVSFTKQLEMKTAKFPWVYECVFGALSRIEEPCELETVVETLTSNQLSLDGNRRSCMSAEYAVKIKAFMDTHPMIVCKSGKYFMIPLNVEADLYGGLYFTEVRNLVTKYQVKAVCGACAMRIDSLRWPDDNGQCKFIIEMMNGVQVVSNVIRTPVKWQRSKFSEQFVSEELEMNQIVRVEAICGQWSVLGEEVEVEKEIAKQESSDVQEYRVLDEEEEEEEIYQTLENEEKEEKKREKEELPVIEKPTRKRNRETKKESAPRIAHDKFTRNMSLIEAIGMLFQVPNELQNGYVYHDLNTIMSELHGHQFKLSNGVSYTINKAKKSSRAIVVAEMLGSDQFQPKKSEFSYIGHVNADYSIAFDGFYDLVLFAAREFHIKWRKSGVCMTMDDLVKECCGRVYFRKECNGHTWVVTDQVAVRRNISGMAKKRGSLILCEMKDGVELFGLLEFSPSPKYKMEPKEERLKWAQSVRRDYEEAFVHRHEPSQADEERHEKHRQELMKRTAKDYAKKSRYDRGLSGEIASLRNAGNQLIVKLAQSSYKENQEYYSDSYSDTDPVPEDPKPQETKAPPVSNTPVVAPSQPQQTMVNEVSDCNNEIDERPWDPPAITFSDYGTASEAYVVHTRQTAHLRTLNRWALPGGEVMNRDTLYKAIDKKVPNLEMVSFDDLVAELYAMHGNGKTHDDFALDVIRAIGKLKAMRSRN